MGFFSLGELLPETAKAFNEPTCLAWGDVAIDNRAAPRVLQFHLKRSKCDQFGKGVDIMVAVTGDKLCPLSTVVEYLKSRGDRKGAFFPDPDGKTVLKPWFVGQIRSILASIGVPQNHYAGHSFRIGAATTAAMAGVENSAIQTLGRWHSAAFLQYL